jgi:hypothetical protein
MPDVRLSRLLPLVLTAAIGSIPIAPPEHVHEADDHGDHHAVVHRHAAIHTGLHHAPEHDGILDDDDGNVVTLDATYIVPLVAALVAPVGALPTQLDQPGYTFAVKAEYVERLIHGPPRAPTGLRGPPLFSCL